MLVEEVPVTFGSLIKLQHKNTGYRLHSHEVKFGGGSGQQSVTAYPDSGDPNSFWVVRSGNKQPHIMQGYVILCVTVTFRTPVMCGNTVRLQHQATGRYLHSVRCLSNRVDNQHLHKSPLSSQQEVSAFGENGTGDGGDNWIVECSHDKWMRDEVMYMKHVDTGVY